VNQTKEGRKYMETTVYLTEKDIDEIEKLNESSICKYIENLSEAKKQLVMKQYHKEIEIKQWKTIAKEKYN